ncbi:Chromosome transmission fidelity protein 18 [Orchesella cincta]|uniref:Chromosome transmission fidelity protein 18 n=1 Tax=Orchesella cincta TaxID=48709 RepID=A0A1D2NJI5_ORCCI|nr:Chromosome transmission fidelity protein 18 [Orchesella cincta]
MDFELMETLSYDGGDDEEDVKSGRKRFGTVQVEDTSRSSKRQRVDASKSRNNETSGLVTIVELDDVDGSSQVSGSEGQSNGTGKVGEIRREDIGAAGVKRNLSLSSNSFRSSATSSAEIPDTTNLEQEVPSVRYRRVLKRIPTDIPYLPLTCEDGSRLYLRYKPADSGEDTTKTIMSTSSKNDFIHGWNDIKNEAKILQEKFKKEPPKTVEKDVILPRSVDGNKENESPSVPDSLWVEKYKPRSFLDLLSQEGVNRALLHWVKLWDKSVFGVDYLAKVKATREKYAKLEAQEKEKNEKFQRKTYFPLNEEYDEGGRPNIKVALLAGDPGLGKTTCAHIIAKHAGYNVREVNASDDRSVQVFRKFIDDTTQSRSEIFQDGRPNCLIIDEIDGAQTDSVNVLVELVTGNATESGKKKAKKILRRPVICICNDLYSTSLKLLRKHAFIIQFPQISVPRLIDRLNEVSDREKLFLDSKTLQNLCHKSECDIRSCLSTLQFLKRKRCSPQDALFAQVGMKDKSKGIFAVWNDIFNLPEEKKYHDTHDPSRPEFRFRNILQTVQSFGEYQKLMGGVFENYLNVKYRDSYMQTVIDGLEWTTWFEDIREYVERTQTYGMYGYMPMYFVMSHFLYARKDMSRIVFPNHELTTKLAKIQNTVKSQINETSIASARFLDQHMLVTEVYPAILSIIQPGTIRPVPTQIWTDRERETLKNVVEVMLTYNICYTQTKNPETGAYAFVLEPDLADMVTFKQQELVVSKKPFPYAIKQLVAREIDTEKLRRNDTVPDVVQRETFKLPETPKSNAGSTPKSKALEVLNKTMVSVARDFFGRPIISEPETAPEAEAKRKSAAAVYFRFKEGYSNAVRRYIKIRDLA